MEYVGSLDGKTSLNSWQVSRHGERRETPRDASMIWVVCGGPFAVSVTSVLEATIAATNFGGWDFPDSHTHKNSTPICFTILPPIIIDYIIGWFWIQPINSLII